MTNAQLYSTVMQTHFSIMALLQKVYLEVIILKTHVHIPFGSCQNSCVGDTSMNLVPIKNESESL